MHGAASLHPVDDVLGRVLVVDQAEPDGPAPCGTAGGGRLDDDDVGLLAHVETFGDAHGHRRTQACGLRSVIDAGDLDTAATAVPADDDTARHGDSPLHSRLSYWLFGHARSLLSRGDPPRSPSRRRPRESPGSRVVARPGLPAPSEAVARRDSLTDHSGGTAPDSHRLPRTAVALFPGIIPSPARSHHPALSGARTGKGVNGAGTQRPRGESLAGALLPSPAGPLHSAAGRVKGQARPTPCSSEPQRPQSNHLKWSSMADYQQAEARCRAQLLGEPASQDGRTALTADSVSACGRAPTGPLAHRGCGRLVSDTGGRARPSDALKSHQPKEGRVSNPGCLRDSPPRQ